MAQKSPEELAQGQLKDYNKQDLEGFLSWYSDSVEIYNFPNELVLKGKDKMRERYREAWKNNPSQRANVTERIVLGSTVIDKEHVTGRANNNDLHVIAVYKVLNGLIQQVYFIRE